MLVMGISPMEARITIERLKEKLDSNLSSGEWMQFGYEMLGQLGMWEEIDYLVPTFLVARHSKKGER